MQCYIVVGIFNFPKYNLQFDEENECYDFSNKLKDEYPELIVDNNNEDNSIGVGMQVGTDNIDFTQLLEAKTKFHKFLEDEFPEYSNTPIQLFTGTYADGYSFR